MSTRSGMLLCSFRCTLILQPQLIEMIYFRMDVVKYARMQGPIFSVRISTIKEQERQLSSGSFSTPTSGSFSLTSCSSVPLQNLANSANCAELHLSDLYTLQHTAKKIKLIKIKHYTYFPLPSTLCINHHAHRHRRYQRPPSTLRPRSSPTLRRLPIYHIEPFDSSIHK